jgi:NADPH:quinone reductase-like Zn-dependent oxidoreductase
MKAAVYEEYGPPSVISIRQVEKPVPQANEVLICVAATTVSRTDCAMLRAKPFIMRFVTGLLKPKRKILGTDFAGQVEAIGPNVASLKTGDRVFGFSDAGVSSQAQYMTFPEDKGISTIPHTFTFQQAAASLEGVHYAYNIINKVNLKEGQRVLVNGASGGIGTATVQLLKYYGAHVTAVCNTKNIELIKSIGADSVIDYTREDFTNSNEKYHYVFDTVGKSTFGRCKSLLEPDGVYISTELGPWSQNLFLALITPMAGGKKVTFPFPSDHRRSVLLIKKIIEEGKFKPVIDRTYPLGEIADAYRYVETGEKTGNVVITIGD